MNQRIRFRGPGRRWHNPVNSQPVSIAPEQLEGRTDANSETAATAAVIVALASQRHEESSWQASSYDLMSGLQITEFEDTIPGALLDDLGL